MNDRGQLPQKEPSRPVVNGTLNLTRVYGDRQFESDPSGVVAVLPASGKNGGQTFSSSLVFAFAACGLAMMPARRLSFSP